MQITIDTHELNAEQLGYLEAIIRVRKEVYLGYGTGDATCSASVSDEEQASDAHNEEQAPKPVEEKPKRTRRTKAEIEAEKAQTSDEASEVVEQEIVASSTVSLTLSDIKTKAQELVTKVSRDAVKNVISKYADKISEVKESDYSALMTDFEALED